MTLLGVRELIFGVRELIIIFLAFWQGGIFVQDYAN